MNTRLDQQGATQASSQNMKATPLYRRIFSHVATPWVILGSGLFVSTLIAIVAKQVVNDRAEVRFQYQSNEVRNTLLQRLEKYELALHSGAALFNASGSATFFL